MGSCCSSLCCCGGKEVVADTAAGRRELIKDSNTVVYPQKTVFRNVNDRFMRVDEYVPSVTGNYMLFTRTYLPNRGTDKPSAASSAGDDAKVSESDSTVKGLICYAIGWGSNVDYMVEEVLLPFARKGYVVFTFDHFGHGRSDGLWMANRMDQVVDDARHCFAQMKEKLNDPFSNVRLHLEFSAHMSTPKAFDESNCFLMGYSMGGGICVDISLKEASLWRAMVLVAPMITLHEDRKPSKCAICCLSQCVPLCADKQWTPGHDLTDDTFQLEAECERFKDNALYYNHKVRLGNGLSILQFTQRIDRQLQDVSLPFYVLHGTEDRVAELKSSENLHELASASSKTLKRYDNAWHDLFRDPHSKYVVFDDISQWIEGKLGEGKEEDVNVEDETDTAPLIAVASDSKKSQ